jgi:hypothetical protein
LLAGAVALAFSASHVCAQSSPGWPTGYKPTAAQWAAAFASKQDVFGIGTIAANQLAGGIGASLLASGAAAANIAGGPIAPSSITLSNSLQLGSYSTPMSAPGGTSAVITNPATFGIYGQAVGCSVVTNSTHGPQVTGITTPSRIATYSSRDSVGCYVDNTAPPAIANVAGTFTATTFVPTVALSAGIVSQLKVGMIIDTSDATKYSGFITAWASDGTSITVSAWYQMGNQGAGQVPSGPNAIINPITKIWGGNVNILFNPSSYATAGTGIELGIQNNYGYNAGTDTPYTWGYDAVNIGTYTASVGHIARGDFNYGFESTSGRLAGFYYLPGSTQVGPGFLVGSTISGATGFETDQTSGTGFLAKGTSGASFAASSTALGQYLALGNGAAPLMTLGSQTAASSPTMQFFANGSSNADVSIAAVSGGGAQYAGKLAVFANALYVVPGGGGNNLLMSGGVGGSNNTAISASGADTNIDISLTPKGTGTVQIPKSSITSLTVGAVPTLPSQTANTFFAAPNGSAGAPTMRAIVAADLPSTLTPNTIQPSSGALMISAPSATALQLGRGGVADWNISNATGTFYPTVSNSLNVGGASNLVAIVYAANIGQAATPATNGYFTNLGASGTPVAKVYASQTLATAAVPTITTCGTSPPAATAGSSNNGGQFTLGTGATAACTVTFATAYPTTAFCTVTPASAYTGTYYISAQSRTAFTVTLGTGTASVIFNYSCAGN